VIFVPGDTTVAGVCDSVVAVAAKAGIPVFTLVPGRPDRGTLFDVGFDFREVGLLAGRLAGDILAGRDPATVPIGETAREIPPRLTVNLTAPGVDPAVWRVPDDLLAQAKVVIDAGGRRDQPEAMLAGPFPEAEPAPKPYPEPVAGGSRRDGRTLDANGRPGSLQPDSAPRSDDGQGGSAIDRRVAAPTPD
jgi:hypothetical protein